MASPAIKIKNLSVIFKPGTKALDKVNVEIPESKVVGFIGPSGAGKTTLIRAIVGRQKVTTGEVRVYDQLAGSTSLRALMSYMTQDLSIYSDLTVRENLEYFAAMSDFRGKQAGDAVNEILETVDLVEQAGQISSSLSGGQKKRVSLAIALIGFPKLIVLDEPTVGLDPVLRGQLWSLFKELASRGSTLIVSSHVMDEAERCDDLLLLRDGQLIAHGSPAELKKSTKTKSVEDSFLSLVGEQQ